MMACNPPEADCVVHHLSSFNVRKVRLIPRDSHALNLGLFTLPSQAGKNFTQGCNWALYIVVITANFLNNINKML